MNSPHERPFFVSKDVLDTVNSVSWFLMDASWMLESRYVSMAMIIPTVLTGILLCYIEKRRNVTCINLAILSWIAMNVSWMSADVYDMPEYMVLAKALFGVGALFILLAVSTSDSVVETFSHFRRFRIKR